MLPRHARRPALAVLLLLLSGCAPLEWHKTGGGEHDVDRDQSECTAQARIEARQRIPLSPTPAPRIAVDQQGRSVVINNTQRTDSEQFFLEQSLLRQCMSERGYTLQSKPE